MRKLTLVAAAAFALTLACATSAHAWTRGAWVNMATGLCLRDSKASGLIMGTCDTTKPTLWTASGYSNFRLRYQNFDTGRCLDDSKNGLMSYECHPDWSGDLRDFQSWDDSGMVAGNAYIQRLDNLETKKCLYFASGMNPRSVRTAPCIQHTASNWKTQAWRWSYNANG